MKEIEVTILEVDVDQLRTQLESLGAQKEFEGDMEVSFYDFDDKSLYNKDKRLRLRTVGDRVEFTLKKKTPEKEAKVVDEFQIQLDSIEDMKVILDQVGLFEFRHFTKHRISYAINGARFEIDSIGNIPPFLEIETTSVDECYRWAKQLGFSKDQIKPWSGSDVVRHYKQKGDFSDPRYKEI